MARCGFLPCAVAVHLTVQWSAENEGFEDDWRAHVGPVVINADEYRADLHGVGCGLVDDIDRHTAVAFFERTRPRQHVMHWNRRATLKNVVHGPLLHRAPFQTAMKSGEPFNARETT